MHANYINYSLKLKEKEKKRKEKTHLQNTERPIEFKCVLCLHSTEHTKKKKKKKEKEITGFK